VAYLAGALLGLAILLMVAGFRRLIDDTRPAAERRRGFWPINAGLLALALSLYLLNAS